MPPLTQALIYQKTKKADLSTITNLNIWGSKLDDIYIMSQITNIEVLAFSVNDVSDLSPLQNCTRLQELYIRRNKVDDLQQIMYLSSLPNLQVLLATENPICSNEDYRLWIIKALPRLKKLDDADVTEQERAEAARKTFKTPHQKPGRSAPAPYLQQQYPSYPNNVKPSVPSYVPPVAKPVAVPQTSYWAQTDMARNIRLAVLNLLNGLDYDSLETIKQQIITLQRDSQK